MCGGWGYGMCNDGDECHTHCEELVKEVLGQLLGLLR